MVKVKLVVTGQASWLVGRSACGRVDHAAGNGT
jgi:hypothetical protein